MGSIVGSSSANMIVSAKLPVHATTRIRTANGPPNSTNETGAGGNTQKYPNIEIAISLLSLESIRTKEIALEKALGLMIASTHLIPTRPKTS